MDIKKNSTKQHFVFNQVTLALSISTQISRMAKQSEDKDNRIRQIQKKQTNNRKRRN